MKTTSLICQSKATAPEHHITFQTSRISVPIFSFGYLWVLTERMRSWIQFPSEIHLPWVLRIHPQGQWKWRRLLSGSTTLNTFLWIYSKHVHLRRTLSGRPITSLWNYNYHLANKKVLGYPRRTWRRWWWRVSYVTAAFTPLTCISSK